MSSKQTQNLALIDHLSRYREINITVTGRKSGRSISIPVWFVLEGEKLSLLPVRGSDAPRLQEPALEFVDSDRCARRGSGVPSRSHH